jgi:hypothetical protein
MKVLEELKLEDREKGEFRNRREIGKERSRQIMRR